MKKLVVVIICALVVPIFWGFAAGNILAQSEITLLTERGGSIGISVESVDGRYLVYEKLIYDDPSDEYGDVAEVQIVSVPIDGSEPPRLLIDGIDESGAALAIAPDNRTVIYLDEYDEYGDIYSVPVMGGEPKKFAEGYARKVSPYFKLSLDGNYVVFKGESVTNGSGYDELFSLSTATGNVIRLTPDRDVSSFQIDSGSQFVVYRDTDDKEWRYCVSITGGSLEVVSPSNWRRIDPACYEPVSPDGKHMLKSVSKGVIDDYFGSFGTVPIYDLYSISLADENQTQLNPLGTDVIDETSISPDGNSYVFVARNSDELYDIYSSTMDGSELFKIYTIRSANERIRVENHRRIGVDSYHKQAFSAGSRYVLFETYRLGLETEEDRLYVADLVNQSTNELTPPVRDFDYLLGYGYSSTADRVVFNVGSGYVSEATQKVYGTRLDGSDVKLLPEGTDRAFVQYTDLFFPDDSVLLATGGDGAENTNLFALPVAGGEAEPIHTMQYPLDVPWGAHSPEFTLDGRHLLYRVGYTQEGFSHPSIEIYARGLPLAPTSSATDTPVPPTATPPPLPPSGTPTPTTTSSPVPTDTPVPPAATATLVPSATATPTGTPDLPLSTPTPTITGISTASPTADLAVGPTVSASATPTALPLPVPNMLDVYLPLIESP